MFLLVTIQWNMNRICANNKLQHSRLLDEPTKRRIHEKKNSVYQFYDNKLYGVGNGISPMIFEIELKGKDSKIKNIEFNSNGKTNPFLITSIKEIKKDNILYSGYGNENGHTIYININCSLLDNECTTIKD